MKTLKHPSYTYRKGGVYYFSKAIPQDLADYYARPRIIKSLRTKSAHRAKIASRSLSAKLEDYWLELRLQRVEVPAAHLLIVPREQLDSKLPTINEALEIYLSVKGQGKGKLFFSHAKRNISYLVSCLGSRPLDCYSTADVAKFRQWLINRGLNNTSLQWIFGRKPRKSESKLTQMDMDLGCSVQVYSNQVIRIVAGVLKTVLLT